MASSSLKDDASHEKILKYDPSWPLKYEKESQSIRELLGGRMMHIEHIGSTSIPGLDSKPIIDIAVLIPSWKEADSLIDSLASLKYVFDASTHEKWGSAERHFFKKGSPTEFHLSVAYNDKASFWERQILFRDYLREHKETRKRYQELKNALISKDPSGQEEYITGKTDFIMSVLKKAGFQSKHFDLSKYWSE